MVAMTLFAASRRPLLLGLLLTGLAACASGTSTSLPPASIATSSTTPAGSVALPRESAASLPVATSAAPADSELPGPTQAPDIGGGTTAGDVPDNAVFLTYQQVTIGFSIQYVEGWQVTTQPDGVDIHDKDSSETVSVVSLPKDVAAYIASTDLPALQPQAGFKFVKQDTVKVGSSTYHHLVYHILSPVDPVTGKRVPSTVDRYYVPGSMGLAVVSLSTPDGVDNVDAFRQMIESFTWG
jgi:hypothetical protein